jgi:hypothetical protein
MARMKSCHSLPTQVDGLFYLSAGTAGFEC